MYPREPEGEEGHKEGDADQAAEEAMAPFPPIDGLELIEAHAAFELEIFGDLLIGVERLLPGAVDSGGMAPVTGFHSVMERPESVSRVAPPMRIIATMRSASAPSQRRKALAWRISMRAWSARDLVRLSAAVEDMRGLIAGRARQLNGGLG